MSRWATMKPNQRLLAIIGAILLFTGISILFGRAVRQHGSRPSDSSVYYCPMHPQVQIDQPGVCPICGMRLVKQTASTVRTTTPPSGHETICYLHHCPRLHEGKPCPMTVVAKPGEAVTCPICGTHIAEAAEPAAPAGQRKILYWTDPMIPGLRSPTPGKSPMGMEMVPVYEEFSEVSTPTGPMPEGYAPVLLTPQKQQVIGVTTAPVQRRQLTKTVRTVGTVAHDPELYQAQQEFIQAVQAWQRAQAGQFPDIAQQAERIMASSRFRLQHMGLSEELIDQISRWTEPDHRLLLGGAGQFWIYASIYEYELPYVQAGQSATIELSALPGQRFIGIVNALDRILDPATRTVRARILVNDPQGVLKPGMYVNASIAQALGEVLAVPQEAIFATGQRQIAFVDKGQGLFEPREVQLGAQADGFYQVTDGFTEGEVVVTSGNFLIDSESRVKGALQPTRPGASEEPHQHVH